MRQFTTYQTGLEQFCPNSPEWYAQMAAFLLCTPERSGVGLPACDGVALQRRLYDEDRVEGPIIEWGGRQLMRVSVQGYNTPENLDSLLSALADLLPNGS